MLEYLLEYLFWRRAIGVREEPTSITGQVAPPPIPSETNDEATSSQTQSLIESQNLLISGGQFSQIRRHYTNIVLNVNPTSENTLTIQGSPSGPVPSNETDHISPGPTGTSSRSTQPSHEGTIPRTEVNQTILTPNSVDIYKRHLISKGRGFPLWVPGPNQCLHLDYRRTGIRIGDVGIINDSGEFSFLFNILLPHDHPVNPPTLPENFSPISPPIEPTDIENFVVYKNNDHIASASIKRSSQSTAISGTGSVFESSASEGAILIMPRGARHEIMRNYAKFRKYASDNVADWYKFVNGPRGREAKNGDVRLVYGFDKTASWGIATFVNETQQNSCRLKFGPPEGDSTSTSTWSENSGDTDVRSGPDSDESDMLRIDGDPSDFQFENQCLFVRTLNVKLTDDVWADIHSTLGSVHLGPRHLRDHSAFNRPQSSTGSPSIGGNLSPSPGAQNGTQRARGSIYGSGNADLVSDNPGMFISGLPERLISHPSKILNDMLLEKVPTAKMAITHDDDWTSVITQYDNTSADPYYDFKDVAANLLASRKICEENGVVFLQPAVEMAHFELSNVNMYEDTFNSAHGGLNINDRDPDFGIQTLSLGVSLEAIHDSAERYPPPNCLPDTRKAVRNLSDRTSANNMTINHRRLTKSPQEAVAVRARSPAPIDDLRSKIHTKMSYMGPKAEEEEEDGIKESDLRGIEKMLWSNYGLIGEIIPDELLKECQRRLRQAIPGSLTEIDLHDELESLNLLHLKRKARNSLAFSQEYPPGKWTQGRLVPPDEQMQSKGIRFWALIIGNDAYTRAPLSGCVNDAYLIRAYLYKYLKVPPDHIRMLKNASRETMVNALYDLRDDEKIRPDDNILIHFSGHGSSYNTREFFSTFASKTGSIDAICPIDRGDSIPDISERELNSILSEVRAAKGPNITIILDCCHAGVVVRSFEGAGDTNVRFIPPIRTGYFDGALNLMGMIKAGNSNERRSPNGQDMSSEFWTPDLSSFVLLAACHDFQYAEEYNVEDSESDTVERYSSLAPVKRVSPRRGRFTWALTRILASEMARNATYESVIASIGRLGRMQVPLAVGSRKNAPLWFFEHLPLP